MGLDILEIYLEQSFNNSFDSIYTEENHTETVYIEYED